MPEDIKITGGAGPEEAAAIAAVVASIEVEEREASSLRPEPNRQSGWIRSHLTGGSQTHVTPDHVQESS